MDTTQQIVLVVGARSVPRSHDGSHHGPPNGHADHQTMHGIRQMPLLLYLLFRATYDDRVKAKQQPGQGRGDGITQNA
jgi:hypothetical protein